MSLLTLTPAAPALRVRGAPRRRVTATRVTAAAPGPLRVSPLTGGAKGGTHSHMKCPVEVPGTGAILGSGAAADVVVSAPGVDEAHVKVEVRPRPSKRSLLSF